MLTTATKEQLKQLTSQGACAVYFTAHWCSACRVYRDQADRASEVLGIPFYELEVGTDRGLVQDYSLEMVPSLYLYLGGELVCKLDGTKPAEEVVNMFEGWMKWTRKTS